MNEKKWRILDSVFVLVFMLVLVVFKNDWKALGIDTVLVGTRLFMLVIEKFGEVNDD